MVLQHRLAVALPGFEGLDALEGAPRPPLTDAAGATFAWALALTALTAVPALFLPRLRAERVVVVADTA